MTVASLAPRLTAPLLRARRRAVPALAVAVGLLLPGLLLYGPVSLGGRTLVPYDVLATDPLYRTATAPEAEPHNGLIADLVLQNDVWKRYLAAETRDGRPPLWNPYLFGGLPFLAAGQHSALYPTTVLFLVMDPARAFGWNALLQCWLAALAMYALGRALGLRRPSAALSGVAWSAGLPFVASTVFPMIQGVYVWTPAVLAAVESVVKGAADAPSGSLLPRRAAVARLLALASATALAALSGHVEVLAYAAMLAAAFSVFRLAGLFRPLGGRATLVVAAWLLAAAGVGGLVAGVQLVPLAELALSSWRAGATDYDTAVGHAYGLRQIVTFLVPDFFGNPAHHGVWDLAGGRRIELAGSAEWGGAVGAKNYVEAAAYVGVLPLLLAAVGLVAGTRRRLAAFLALAAAVSLAFAFGLPVYRVLFVGVPGFDQLHTPFRWVFPFALAVVVLAGIGADALLTRGPGALWGLRLGGLAAGAGLALGLPLWIATTVPERWNALVDGVLAPHADVRGAVLEHFPDVGAFASYQLWNLFHLAVFLALGGVVVAWMASRETRDRAAIAAIVVVAADLALISVGFHPALDAGLADVRPAASRWLADAVGAKWGRVVGFGEQKVLWPNTAMRWRVPDVRGYDSLIPRWSVETLSSIATGATSLDDPDRRDPMLAYNRIGNLTRAESLAHPGLAALGARYVVTTEEIDREGLRLVYRDPGGPVRVYESARAMPRAWVVDEVRVVADREQLLADLATFDPARTALVEVAPDDAWSDLAPGRPIARPSSADVREDGSSSGGLSIEVWSPGGGLLVVGEAWFPDWRAEVQAAGSQEVVPVPVYRADGMLRAVPVPPGRSTVRMWYAPASVRLGLFLSFLGAVLLLLAIAYGLWDRFARVAPGDEAGRVAVNISGPMGASLLGKVVDFVFAMLALRILGSANAGSYYYAVNVIGLAEILGNFGLNVLTVREVARRPGEASRLLASTSLLRVALWALVLPVLAGYVSLEGATGHPLDQPTVVAVALLALALLPGSLATGVSATLQGREQLVAPAAVSIVATLVKVSAGALVLLAGAGFVGLAGVAVGTNLVTLVLLVLLARRAGIGLARPLPPAVTVGLVSIALPLMLSHLLQTVFFKIDVVLLRRFQGPDVVGWYSAAYKWIDALLIIPPAVTMALFPLLARRAESDREGMRRAFVRALRWLIAIALPIATATTFAAETLVGLLGGPEFIPHGATALQIMIWFLPLSFANGLIQYVLVVLDRRRLITASFALAAAFNVAVNLYVIPRYSYGGAAAVTILSEVVLLVPFWYGLRELHPPPLVVLAWRPAIATSLMATVLAGLDALGAPLAVGLPASGLVYAAALVRLGGLPPEDRALMARLVRPGAGSPGDGAPPEREPLPSPPA